MTERANEGWLDTLRGPGREEALADRPDMPEAGLGELSHAALLRTPAKIDSFCGESRLINWAHKIADCAALPDACPHTPGGGV